MCKQIKPFRSEQELVDLFRFLQTSHRSYRGYNSLFEFECTNGIADIVLYELKKNWHNHTSIGKINPRWVYALREMPYRRDFTLNYFISETGLPQKLALKALKEFHIAGYCEPKLNNIWQKIKQPQPIAKKIASYEAKLKNWRRALEQAYRYKDFSNQSWVIMDEYHISPALEKLKEFSSRNIGLASINTRGIIKVHSKIKNEEPRSRLYNWTANAKIAAILDEK